MMRGRFGFAVRGAGVALGLTLVGALAAPVFAGPGIAPVVPLPSVPLLSITATDAVTSPRIGDRVTYAVTVADRDRVELPLQMRVTVPANLGAVEPADGAVTTGSTMTWSLALQPGQGATVHFTATVRDPARTRIAPDDPMRADRLAVTACAYLGGSDRPTACASDLDTVASVPGRSPWLPLGLSVVAVALAGAGVLAVRRRRGGRAVSPAGPGSREANGTVRQVPAGPGVTRQFVGTDEPIDGPVDVDIEAGGATEPASASGTPIR